MKDHQPRPRKRSRTKSRSNPLLYALCAIIILFVTIFYFYTKKESVNAHLNNQQTEENFLGLDSNNPQSKIDSIVTPADENAGTAKETSDLALQQQAVTAVKDASIFQGNEPGSSLSTIDQQTLHSTDYQESDDSINTTGSVAKKAAPLVNTLNSFYEHLDQQPYMNDFHMARSSKIHFSRLLQKLVDSPPVVVGETNDLFTILKNTAHFFRILGKENVIVLKGILDREKGSFENILKTFYTLTDYPEVLEKEYGLSLPHDVIYDYAGFFLNTMGGRLYLFRRDSASRLAVSYYSILVIHEAIKDGNNRHGIDLLPAIDFLIEEMENTGKHLLLKEEYLDTLYNLKEQYN